MFNGPLADGVPALEVLALMPSATPWTTAFASLAASAVALAVSRRMLSGFC